MSASSSATGLPNRDADPVVLTGIQTPKLIGTDPGDVVAFAWNGSWKQVPVQVDERKIASYNAIRNGSPSNRPFSGEVYADPATLTGADGDVNVDSDDEIALMSKDSGLSAAGKPDPAGVTAGTRTAIRIKDPLGGGAVRYLYLFGSKGALKPAAGTDYVSYELEFDPTLVGGYFSGYDFGGIDDKATMPPANPESSSVKTAVYEQTFPGKWMIDGLRIKIGGSTGVDILDGDKSTVGPTGCGRNELTFSRGDGGLIANIDGPVRAIRSYIGANSGTFTQRDQIYYEGLMVNNTYIRVHSGITDFVTAMDYSENAFGMIYRNSLNKPGVLIDGVPDTVTEGKLDWESVTGRQGSLVAMTRVKTNVDRPEISSYYADEMTPSPNSSMLCSGDVHSIGASGPRIETPYPDRPTGDDGPNTDPTLGPAEMLEAYRHTYYGPPNETVAKSELLSRQVDSPLVVDTGDGVDPTGPTGPVGPTGPTSPEPTQPGRQNWVGLKVSSSPAVVRARIGSSKKLRVKVRNIGDKVARKVRICPVAHSSLVWTGKCVVVRTLKPDRLFTRTFRVKLRRAASGRKQVKVRFRAKATKSKARSATTLIRPVG